MTNQLSNILFEDKPELSGSLEDKLVSIEARLSDALKTVKRLEIEIKKNMIYNQSLEDDLSHAINLLQIRERAANSPDFL